MPTNDPIRHAITLITQNRSFAHMTGGLTTLVPGLDGVVRRNPHYDLVKRGV
jgi:hypothetical protein